MLGWIAWFKILCVLFVLAGILTKICITMPYLRSISRGMWHIASQAGNAGDCASTLILAQINHGWSGEANPFIHLIGRIIGFAATLVIMKIILAVVLFVILKSEDSELSPRRRLLLFVFIANLMGLICLNNTMLILNPDAEGPIVHVIQAVFGKII